jgi:hypothetical protein
MSTIPDSVPEHHCNLVIDACEEVVSAVIDGCREEGETDLRSVRHRIESAFCLLRKHAMPKVAQS